MTNHASRQVTVNWAFVREIERRKTAATETATKVTKGEPPAATPKKTGVQKPTKGPARK